MDSIQLVESSVCCFKLELLTQLTLQQPNSWIEIFNHLKLCLADAIHNFKWVKIIQICQNRGYIF